MTPIEYDKTEMHELDAFGNIIVKQEVKEVQEVQKIEDEPIVQLKCQVCGKEYKNLKRYNTHSLTHK